jgi:hypothetical protein
LYRYARAICQALNALEKEEYELQAIEEDTGFDGADVRLRAPCGDDGRAFGVCAG